MFLGRKNIILLEVRTKKLVTLNETVNFGLGMLDVTY